MGDNQVMLYLSSYWSRKQVIHGKWDEQPRGSRKICVSWVFYQGFHHLPSLQQIKGVFFITYLLSTQEFEEYLQLKVVDGNYLHCLFCCSVIALASQAKAKAQFHLYSFLQFCIKESAQKSSSFWSNEAKLLVQLCLSDTTSLQKHYFEIFVGEIVVKGNVHYKSASRAIWWKIKKILMFTDSHLSCFDFMLISFCFTYALQCKNFTKLDDWRQHCPRI